MDENRIGQIAVAIATKGEEENIGNIKIKCNWKKLGNFVGVWLLTAIVLLGSLILITIVKGSNNILYDTIKEVDTLNMMFSLILSALLEQIWSKEYYNGWLYKLTLGLEGAMTIIGGMLFIAYSIIKIVAPENALMRLSFEFNIGYIIASSIVVLVGFYSRSTCEKV